MFQDEKEPAGLDLFVGQVCKKDAALWVFLEHLPQELGSLLCYHNMAGV